jgi:hypothetical protein
MRYLLIAAAGALASCGAQDTGANNVAGNELTRPPADVAQPQPGGPPEANEAAPAPPVADANMIPAPFQGRYDESEAACGGTGEKRLVVTGTELRFLESIGTVRSVSDAGSRAVSVTADYQGEGESWRNVRTLALAPDGSTLTISGDGTSLTRTRCP